MSRALRLEAVTLAAALVCAGASAFAGTLQAEFFVNGERVAGVSDSSVGGRRIGLIAFGSGTFSFDNLGLNSKGDTGVPDGPTGPAPVGGSTPPPLPGPAVSPNAPAATPSPNAPPPN